MIECNRCGRCCYHKGKPCKFLISNGIITACQIYKVRLGAILDIKQRLVCIRRKDHLYNYTDCPYNKPTNKFAF